VTRDVRAQVDPIVSDITRRLNAAAAAGTRNIAGVTSELENRLAGYPAQVADIYGRARSSLESTDQQLADRLATSGKADADALRARLTQAGLATEAADKLAAEGAGASAAGFARGSAELGQLTQQQAAGELYASKLPGLARLTGLQEIGQRRAQHQRDLSDQLGEVRSQVSGVAAGLLQDSREREVNKAIALRTFGLDAYKLDQEGRQFASQEARRRQELAETRRANRADESATGAEEARQRAEAAETARHNRESERNARQQAAMQGRTYNDNLSRERGYAVDSRGREILDERGRRIKVRRTKPQAGKSGSGKRSGWVPGP
jgi:hypothetical protein